MPWRLPVGLDALLPSCRACKAAALFVWHRHAGPHRRDPLRRSHAPSTSLHRVAVPCSTPSPRLVPRLFCACRSVLFCRVRSLPCAAAPPSCLYFAPWGRLHSAPAGSPPLCSMGSPPFRSCGVASTLLHGVASTLLQGSPLLRSIGSAPLCSRGRLYFAPRGRLHFAPRARRRPENSRFEASFSVSGRRASTKM